MELDRHAQYQMMRLFYWYIYMYVHAILVKDHESLIFLLKNLPSLQKWLDPVVIGQSYCTKVLLIDVLRSARKPCTIRVHSQCSICSVWTVTVKTSSA